MSGLVESALTTSISGDLEEDLAFNTFEPGKKVNKQRVNEMNSHDAAREYYIGLSTFSLVQQTIQSKSLWMRFFPPYVLKVAVSVSDGSGI